MIDETFTDEGMIDEAFTDVGFKFPEEGFKLISRTSNLGWLWDFSWINLDYFCIIFLLLPSINLDD